MIEFILRFDDIGVYQALFRFSGQFKVTYVVNKTERETAWE